MREKDPIVSFSDPILVTGSNGFIGPRVVMTLLDYGFVNLRCFVRPSSELTALTRVVSRYKTAHIEICSGNLLSQEDCDRFTEGVRIVYHLAAAMRDTSLESSYMNNVVTTRHILNAVAKHKILRRFVNVSSLRVYSNMDLKRGALLDESCAVESDLENRGDAYCNAKVKQDDLVAGFCTLNKISYVILRPGIVYGPGNRDIPKMIGRRVRKGALDVFLHLGGSNRLPLSYVDNCADAIVLAGIKEDADREIINVVDDDLMTSRSFLRLYKHNVRQFRSLYVPYPVMYAFCCLGETYSRMSKRQALPALNRRNCASAWKGNAYSNEKLKQLLGWRPKVGLEEALCRYFGSQQDVAATDDCRQA